MPNPRGRPTNEERTRRAAEAAAEAQRAARTPDPVNELPMESPQVEQEEKSELTYRAPRNDARDRAMKEITDRDIQTKTGLGMELGLTDEETPKVDVPHETPPDLPPPTAESMLQGGKFSAPPVKVKVDGEEYEVSQQEIDEYGGIKAYQIAKAGENRLQKANEVLEQARKLQEEVKKPPEASPNDWMKQKMETLRWGNPDESAAAFEEILSKREKPVDQEMLVNMAVDKIRHDDAVKAFDKEFADIGTSREYLELVMFKRAQRLQKGHPGDWGNFYRSIGNEVRAVMPKQSQPGITAKTPDTPSQLSVKEERKSSIVNLPTATALKADLQEEPKTETREEIFAKMRKKRGLPNA